MGHAYHAVIGTEEIRLPLDQVEGFRSSALAAARDGASWVPIRLSATRLIEVLISPYSTVRIETIETDDDAYGADGATDPAWP